VKSRRNGSVDGEEVGCRGAGGGAILFVDDVLVEPKEDGCEVDIDGEVIGAFILRVETGWFLVKW
jgi:hypothetical protein